MQIAAIVARYFRIDPVVVLDSDYFTWAVRVATLQYATAEEKKAADKNNRSKYAADSRINRIG